MGAFLPFNLSAEFVVELNFHVVKLVIVVAIALYVYHLLVQLNLFL